MQWLDGASVTMVEDPSPRQRRAAIGVTIVLSE